jgi:uncharacterized membrane protein HdeD (DUF308 family)
MKHHIVKTQTRLTVLVTGVILFLAGLTLVILRYADEVSQRPWGLMGFVLAVAGALAIAYSCVLQAVESYNGS